MKTQPEILAEIARLREKYNESRPEAIANTIRTLQMVINDNTPVWSMPSKYNEFVHKFPSLDGKILLVNDEPTNVNCKHLMEHCVDKKIVLEVLTEARRNWNEDCTECINEIETYLLTKKYVEEHT